ncbi:amino acid ABC transporter permease [Aestuariivirga sp.]|uniref:amino acid ABC transporter permease n=1 Tax=Aestuariivirga sp. TaxID=2650926 RepID=UPI0039E590F0
MARAEPIAYVRSEDAPRLPPPANMSGVYGWMRANLFSSLLSSILTILLGAFALWVIWGLLDFALFRAVWSGADRNACLGEQLGACWPMARDKLPQWIYGFYPIDQRWRVNLCFLALVAGAVPMLIPSAPYKGLNAIYLFIVFPLIALILLTGGNLNFGPQGYVSMVVFLLFLASLVPLIAFGVEDGISRNFVGLGLAALALILWLASFAIDPIRVRLFDFDYDAIPLAVEVLSCLAGLMSLAVTVFGKKGRGMPVVAAWGLLLLAIMAAMFVLDIDFGLQRVETPQWGGFLVTMVVAITGIVTSLPLGILLALGRRSQMPVVKFLSITFIELIRAVPLITVLFMSSVMLPLFLPPGVSFDKLLRALIGVALFSSAYMAETVRGGLQAIPKGQYEGAQALGLSYWQMMYKIVLPQALKISIPNIVGNFISLFKDTTLVLIIGLFDLLGIVQSSLRDAAWATPVSAPTGYLSVALIYWVCCFGMSRYAAFTERRLQTGHKR